MSRAKKIWAAITAALVGVTAAVVIATPAQAAFSDCQGTYNRTVAGCGWVNADGTSSMMFFYTSGLCSNLGSGWNDVISSVKNTTDAGLKRRIRLYRDVNCGGPYVDINYGVTYPFGPGSYCGACTAYNDWGSAYKTINY